MTIPRLTFLFMLLAGLTLSAHAQTATTIQCVDGETYAVQATIALPPIAEDAPGEFRITVVPAGDALPIVGVTIPDGDTFCNEGESAAAAYELRTDETQIPPDEASAQEIAFDPGQNLVQIGTVDDVPGSFLVVIEGEFFPEAPGDHLYRVTLPADESLPPPRALLFALDGASAPALQVREAQGEGTQAEPITAQLLTDIESSDVAVGAEISAEAEVIVPYRDGGRYALALLFSTGTPPDTRPTATVTESETGELLLTCADTPVAENALEVMLPDDGEAYTLTALGVDEYDPVLAAVDAEGSGVCVEDDAGASDYGLMLPDLEAAPSVRSSQVQAAERRRIIVADQIGEPGEVALLLEGGSLEGETGDTYTLRLTPGMVSAGNELRLYAIALTTDLDPVLALDAGASALFGEEEPILCDNAGQRATCYSAPPLLNDSTLMLAGGAVLRGYELDAALFLPLDGLPAGSALPVTVRAQDGSSGGYVLVMQVVTD